MIAPEKIAEWEALDEPTEAMIEAAAAAHFLRMYPHSVTKWRSLSKLSFVRSTHIEAAEQCLLAALEVSAAREAVPALIAELTEARRLLAGAEHGWSGGASVQTWLDEIHAFLGNESPA